MSIVIVGAGPNLGLAVARRFGHEGMSVGLIARDGAKLEELANVLNKEGITADFTAVDIRDPDAFGAAIGSLAQRLGPVEVLEYSPLPAKEFMKPILETSVEDVRGPLEFSVLGAVAAATAVVGPMVEARSGSILYTTGGAATPAATTSPTTSPRRSGATTPTAASSRSASASTEARSSFPAAGPGAVVLSCGRPGAVVLSCAIGGKGRPRHKLRPMCRLFALHSGERDVAAEFWLLDAPDSMVRQSEVNADGYGLAALTASHGMVLVRNPVEAATTRPTSSWRAGWSPARCSSTFATPTPAASRSSTRTRSARTAGSSPTTASSATSTRSGRGSARIGRW
jgi:hypothetical protein